MGRPKSQEAVLRPEVRLVRQHPAARRLLREAQERDVSLAQHIHDLLIAREAALSGQDYDRLLWVPVERPSGAESPPAEDVVPAGRASGAAAAVWLKRKRGG